MIERRRSYPRTLARDRKIIDLYFGLNGKDATHPKMILIELKLSSVSIVYDALRRFHAEQSSKTFQNFQKQIMPT
jgi:hypothetical protein